MPATRRLVLDLPVEQADRIEAEVAAGRYATASAFVSDLLAEQALSPEHDGLDWDALAADVAGEARRIDAGEVRTYGVEEVFAELEARIAGRAAELRKRA